MSSTNWQKIIPINSDYRFINPTQKLDDTYQRGWAISEIFNDNGAGIVTAHDNFSIAIDQKELLSRFNRFRAAQCDEVSLHSEFNVAFKAGWSIEKGWKALAGSQRKTDAYIRPIVFAPFDLRSIFYEDHLVWRTVRKVMDKFEGTNIAILSSRQTKDDISALVTEAPFRHKAATRYDISYGFPLWAGKGQENLSPDFRAFLDARYSHHYAPEEVLGYIYAVLHAPTYRSRYADFLRIDFPRIPFPQKRSHFDALSALGWALVQAHLLRDLPRGGLAKYAGKGDHSVERVVWGAADQCIHINDSQSFGPVPEPVWRFTIGGYQVLDKYLKSRKGRRLGLDEINHLGAVADSLAFTIEQMARIDKAWAKAFPDRG